PDVFGLSGEEREVLAEQKAGRALAGSLGFHPGGAVHEEIAADDRQPHAAVLRRITHHALGLAAAHPDRGILETALAHQDGSAIALAEVLLRAVGDRALSDPGDDVLPPPVPGEPP